MCRAVGVGIALLLAWSAGCKEDSSTAPGDISAASGASASAGRARDELLGEMVRVPALTYMKESDGASHEVAVDAFEIDKTEVTVRAYRACVEAGACEVRSTVDWEGLTDRKKRLYSLPCNWGRPGRDMHPMNCVDWQDASNFCRWAGKRLPTEQEWEAAARGAAGNSYPWGEAAPDRTRLNACGRESVRWARAKWNRDWFPMYEEDDGWPTTSPVGSYPLGASPFGLLDMGGNVWEWTASQYEQGDDAYRVQRGGSWNNNDEAHVRGAFRNRLNPTFRNCNLGFRCAR